MVLIQQKRKEKIGNVGEYNPALPIRELWWDYNMDKILINVKPLRESRAHCGQCYIIVELNLSI